MPSTAVGSPICSCQRVRERRLQRLAEHHTGHVRPRRVDRNSDSDLPSTSQNRPGQQPMDPHSRQQQSQPRRGGEYRAESALPRKTLRSNLVQAFHVKERFVPIDLQNRATYGGRPPEGRAFCPNQPPLRIGYEAGRESYPWLKRLENLNMSLAA